jgi:short-subunit dehydrogenase
MITGASDWIGLETARQYVAEGARVPLVSRGIQKLRATVDSLGESVEVAAVDLTDRAALDTSSAQPRCARLHAGCAVALARLTHRAAGRMKAAGRGAIVNLSAAVATRPVPWFAAYAASKAFVTSLSQALDFELRPHGVGVSVIHPPCAPELRRTSLSFSESASTGQRACSSPGTTLVSPVRAAVSPSRVLGKRSSSWVAPHAYRHWGSSP